MAQRTSFRFKRQGFLVVKVTALLLCAALLYLTSQQEDPNGSYSDDDPSGYDVDEDPNGYSTAGSDGPSPVLIVLGIAAWVGIFQMVAWYQARGKLTIDAGHLVISDRWIPATKLAGRRSGGGESRRRPIHVPLDAILCVTVTSWWKGRGNNGGRQHTMDLGIWLEAGRVPPRPDCAYQGRHVRPPLDRPSMQRVAIARDAGPLDVIHIDVVRLRHRDDLLDQLSAVTGVEISVGNPVHQSELSVHPDPSSSEIG